VKVVQQTYRPSLRTLGVTVAVIAAISALGVVTNQDGLAAVVTILVGLGVIGWWVAHRR
jgi:FtsH-binding integral membrane protein